MKSILLMMSLLLSYSAFADVCEVALRSTPYKPGIVIKSFVDITCEKSQSATTEYSTMQEAKEAYMQVTSAFSKWKMGQCQYVAQESKYGCRYESP